MHKDIHIVSEKLRLNAFRNIIIQNILECVHYKNKNMNYLIILLHAWKTEFLLSPKFHLYVNINFRIFRKKISLNYSNTFSAQKIWNVCRLSLSSEVLELSEISEHNYGRRQNDKFRKLMHFRSGIILEMHSLSMPIYHNTWSFR